MKKKDFIVILCLIILLALCFLLSGTKTDGAYVEIRVDNEVFGVYPLNVDKDIHVKNNTVEIKNSLVSMTSADCPDKLCVKSKPISKCGETICCLPCKITLSIIDELNKQTVTALKLGTIVTITIEDNSDPELLQDCLDICDRFDSVCSCTNTSSELYLLNHRLINSDDNTYSVSNELYNLLSEGVRYSKQSDGRFNIGIGAITSLWNFSGNSDAAIPNQNTLSKNVTLSGYENIELLGNNTIRLKNDTVQIDLGALAKGYIADYIRAYLIDHGVTRATISLGGDTTTIGSDFTIGIQKPFSPEGTLITTVEVSDESVVTSGTYERCFEKDGKLYHHIIDPSTGYPYESDLTSVSVILPSATDGDFYATYLFSLGEKDAYKYACENNIKAIFVTKDGSVISTID